MRIEKIQNHEHAAVCVRIYDDGTIVLQSYATDVIVIDHDGFMTVNGLYSRTTIKHIGWFMRLYGNGFTYYTAKELYRTGEKLNIYTGEIV